MTNRNHGVRPARRLCVNMLSGGGRGQAAGDGGQEGGAQEEESFDLNDEPDDPDESYDEWFEVRAAPLAHRVLGVGGGAEPAISKNLWQNLTKMQNTMNTYNQKLTARHTNIKDAILL